MNLSVDAEPNDGVVGHPDQGTDDIRTDEENVIGGPFDDTILGSPRTTGWWAAGGQTISAAETGTTPWCPARATTP